MFLSFGKIHRTYLLFMNKMVSFKSIFLRSDSLGFLPVEKMLDKMKSKRKYNTSCKKKLMFCFDIYNGN